MNLELLEKQKVTKEQQEKLLDIYSKIEYLVDNLDTLPNIEVVKTLEDYEYQLQENWNFDKDKTKHTYWYRLPGCNCPKIDNKENFGVNRRIINLSCPFHGDNVYDRI